MKTPFAPGPIAASFQPLQPNSAQIAPLRDPAEIFAATLAPFVTATPAMHLDPEPILDFARRLNFHPDPVQCQILETQSPRVILNCTRQWGKSTTVALRAAWHAIHHPDHLILVLSRAEKQAAEFVAKAERFLLAAGLPLRRDPANRIGLTLPNRSRILAVASIEQTVRGFSPHMLVLDEASKIPDSAYEAVLPMLGATQGSLWLISTPWGKQGFFWEEWTRGEAWQRFQVKATDCPRISSAYLDEMRDRRGEAWVRQEFLCEFVAADDRMFDRDDLDALFSPGLRAERHFNGEGRDFCFGIDLGKLADSSAIAILERITVRDGFDRYTVRETFRTRHVLRYLERIRLGTAYPKVIDRIRELAADAARAGRLTLAIDATGLGEPVFDALRSTGIPGELVAVTLTGGDESHHTGFRWHVPRKALLVGLQGQVCRRELEIASDLPLAADFIAEMASMGRNLHAPAGAHDDLVMAVSLAAWAARKHPRGRLFPQPP